MCGNSTLMGTPTNAEIILNLFFQTLESFKRCKAFPLGVVIQHLLSPTTVA